MAQLSHEGRQRLNAIPGVEESAFTCCLPIQGQFGLPFTMVGKPVDPSKGPPGAGWMSASPDYYKLFRIPVLRGREFTDQDTAGAPGVALINEALAKQFFPKENPVGQQIVIGHGVGPDFEEPARQIVGVVANTHEGGLSREPGPLMIVPDAQVTDGMTRPQCGHCAPALGHPHPPRSASTYAGDHGTTSPGQRRIQRDAGAIDG